MQSRHLIPRCMDTAYTEMKLLWPLMISESDFGNHQCHYHQRWYLSVPAGLTMNLDCIYTYMHTYICIYIYMFIHMSICGLTNFIQPLSYGPNQLAKCTNSNKLTYSNQGREAPLHGHLSDSPDPALRARGGILERTNQLTFLAPTHTPGYASDPRLSWNTSTSSFQ